ncbi:hypothetical protein GALMADRAFT_1059122 [Galerina marginata CBS 339.88]|uniref:2'-phosphotransferase n=1 Tax=Galerina marginata (strain CBS 339.88) TaxID=685588 RepID=A0A067SJY0_GALM3|nr:hypothetical protein GALMADRAFT_1059122 [Galerina marginata CBS 339.88]
MQVAAVRCSRCTHGLPTVTRTIFGLQNHRRVSNKPAYASPWVENPKSRALSVAKGKGRDLHPTPRPMLFGPIPDLVPKNDDTENTSQSIFGDFTPEPEPPPPEPTPPAIVQPPPPPPPPTRFSAVLTTRPPVHLIPREEMTRKFAFSNVTSMILRETARSLGYQIVPDGFVRVSDVMRHEFYRDYNFKMFADLCHEDLQDRFELSFLPDYLEGQLRDVWWVRARSEHIIPWVDRRTHRILNMGKLQVVTYLCKPSDWDEIRPGHFVPMYRSLAGNLFNSFAIPRNTKALCVTIDAEKAAQVGVMFFSTYDKKLLAVGNRDRVVPPETLRSAIMLEVSRTDLLAK